MTHHVDRVILPFTALVGQEKLKKALVLNAINPRLCGVLVRGEKGTAKSTAVRALQPGILAEVNQGILLEVLTMTIQWSHFFI